MKLLLNSLFVVVAAAAAWGSTISAAPSPSTTPPQSAVYTVYAGDKCSGTPISVRISPVHNGVKCQPRACTRVNGADTSTDTACVSSADTDLVKTVKTTFKKEAIVMNVFFPRGDRECKGKPDTVLAAAAGACLAGRKLSINKDRSVVTKYYKDNACTGAPTFEQTQDKNTTKGLCKNRAKTFALKDASK